MRTSFTQIVSRVNSTPPKVTASLAMLAFAGNSLLCRMALRETTIDPASFTSLRVISGASMLWLIIGLTSRRQLVQRSSSTSGSWVSGAALFAYAAAFSFAYVALPAGIGALLLFASVQATMIGYALSVGERLSRRQVIGLCLALGGLVGLLLPGISTPSLPGSLLMVVAGIAWGAYSLRGKSSNDPIATTAGNFLLACPMTILLSAAAFPSVSVDWQGSLLAVLSGAVTSALGYVIWYSAVAKLDSTSASVVQLSVPVLAALGGIVLLGESLTLSLVLAASAIVLGILMVILGRT